MVKHDSIFYKKKFFIKKEDYLLNKDNLFFFDPATYSSDPKLNSVGHMVHPTNFAFDYFSLKNKLCVILKSQNLCLLSYFLKINFQVLKNFI